VPYRVLRMRLKARDHCLSPTQALEIASSASPSDAAPSASGQCTEQLKARATRPV
jgi:hypothetical protein